MQKRFLKIALIGAVFASTAFASGGDLLSQATDGVVVTSKSVGVQVLSNEKMQNVVGGYLTNFSTASSTSMYFQRSAEITEGYYGYQAKIFYRVMRSNGATQYWVNFYPDGFNGSLHTAAGLVANKLVAQYSAQIARGY